MPGCGDCSKKVSQLSGPAVLPTMSVGSIPAVAVTTMPPCDGCRRKWWFAFWLGLGCGYIAFRNKRNG